MKTPTPETIVFVAASAVTVVGAAVDRPFLQRVAKPLIAPALAVRALRAYRDDECAGKPVDTVDTGLTVAGLAAATVGDWYLLAPDDDARLVRGAGWFAAMQVAYAARWLARGARPTRAAVIPRVAGWAAATTAMALKAPALALPLGGYGLALGASTALASDPALMRDRSALSLRLTRDHSAASLELTPTATTLAGLPLTRRGIGALLFTVSDALIIVRKLFLRDARARRLAEAAILSTYIGAQWGLTS